MNKRLRFNKGEESAAALTSRPKHAAIISSPQSESKDTAKIKLYRTAFGSTDYDIPMFGFRAALFLFVAILGIAVVIPAATQSFLADPRKADLLLCSPLIGFSVSYAQNYLSKTHAKSCHFLLVGLIVTVISFGVLFIIYYAGVIY